ncbi:MAG: hypothetical protein J6C05_08895 [Prevotella sp.]|nr:hypothetical protein [Prevotella sp.]MBO5157225.1 hypothetical protein [Prevotella sp.]
MSKAYKVRIVVTKTMWVTQDDIDADINDGSWLSSDVPELDENVAINFVKGTLIEEMRNNPNRGSADIISIYDSETKTLKTKRKYLK